MPVAQTHKQKLWLLLLLLAYFGATYLVMYRTGISCVFQHFLGIPCPGCGMTRAFLCLTRLDFAGAWRYNPLIFAMPYVFCYLFFHFKSRIHIYCLWAIGALAVVNWVICILRM